MGVILKRNTYRKRKLRKNFEVKAGADIDTYGDKKEVVIVMIGRGGAPWAPKCPPAIWY